jgi:hypothetical protein
MIYIKDRHIYKGPGIYVGQEMPYLGLAGNVLGNRCDGRTHQERIANFRRDLWEEMKRREQEYWELKRIADLCRRTIKLFPETAVPPLFKRYVRPTLGNKVVP